MFYAPGTIWNQLFLNKKKSQCEWWRRCLLVCRCQLPFLCSIAAQCEAAAAVADLGRAGFVQSCSNPSGGNAEEALHFYKTNQAGVLIERACAWVLLCIAWPCVCMCDSGGTRMQNKNLIFLCPSVRTHNKLLHVFTYVCKCISLCIHLHMWASCVCRAWFVNVSGNVMPTEVLKKCCVVWQ